MSRTSRLSLPTLAAKNVRHQAQSYAAFFLSSAFAVWLFYLYASLLHHPEFQADRVPPPFRSGITAVQYIVAGFAVLFILHTHAAFLKARQKELGLLALLGLRPGQIARTVHVEHAVVGLAAVLAGVAMGTVCTKLFLLGFSRILGLPAPLPFHFSIPATGLTWLVFAGVFVAISLYTRFALWRLSVADLIRGASKPRPLPPFSRRQVALFLLGLAGVGGAYGLLLTTTAWPSERRVLSILGLLLGGTYLLFSRGSVLALRLLRGNRRLYYRDTNLVTISQLVNRTAANARLLFMISILTAGVLVPLGMMARMYTAAEQGALDGAPVGLMVVGQPGGVGPARVAAVLRERSLAIAGEAHLPMLLARTDDARADPWPPPGGDHRVMVLSASGFNRWLADVLRQPPFALEPGRAALVERWGGTQGTWTTIHLRFGDEMVGLPIARPARFLEIDGRDKEIEPFNSHPLTWMVVVADDATFADLLARYGPTHGDVLHGYALPQWPESGDAIAQVEREAGVPAPVLMAGQVPGPITATVRAFEATRQEAAFSLFLTSFVGVLFFLATGNMLYFTLFTQLAEDRRQFQALYKLGLGPDEVRRIVSTQTLVLFFAPFAVGLAHAAAIVQMYGTLQEVSTWRLMLAVGLVYGLLLAGYYLVTRRTYVAALLNER